MSSLAILGLRRWSIDLGSMRKLGALSLLVLVGSFGLAAQLHAEVVILSIDPSQSSVELDVVLLGTSIAAQDPGVSNITTYSGLIAVDVDVTGAPTSLAILGSDFRAANTGNWLPGLGGGNSVEDLGTLVPSNYGYIIPQGVLADDGWLAFRNLSYNITQPAESVSSGSFSSNNQFFRLLPGSTWAINLPQGGLISPDEDLIFEDPIDNDPNDPEDGEFNLGTSSYTVTGSDVTLNIPVDLLPFNSTTEFVSLGTLIATADLSNPLTSDFDLDGDTDGSDFLAWQRGFGIQGTAVVTDGDSNGDGNVDEQDLAIWRTLDDFVSSLSAPTPPVTSIPEPASVMLAGFAALLLSSGVLRHSKASCR